MLRAHLIRQMLECKFGNTRFLDWGVIDGRDTQQLDGSRRSEHVKGKEVIDIAPDVGIEPVVLRCADSGLADKQCAKEAKSDFDHFFVQENATCESG